MYWRRRSLPLAAPTLACRPFQLTPSRPAPPRQDLERIASGIPLGATQQDIERVSSNLNMLAISAISPIGSPGATGLLGGHGVPPLTLPIGSPPGAMATLSLSAAGWGSPRNGAKLVSPLAASADALNGGPAVG